MSRADTLAKNDQEVQDYVLGFKQRPYGPTQAQFANDDSLVTAAFLKRAGVQYSSFSSNSSNLVMTAAYVGGIHSFSSAGLLTATLPSTVGIEQAATITLVCSGAGGLNIVAADGDTVFTANGITGPILMGLGDTAEFIRLQNQWRLVGGSTGTKFSNLFSSMPLPVGYQKLPSGLILQWGWGTSSVSGDITVVFPTNFATGLFALVPGVGATAGALYGATVNSQSKNGFAVSVYSGSARIQTTFYWFAIGL